MKYSKIIKPLFYSLWLAVTAANAQTAQPKAFHFRQIQREVPSDKSDHSAQISTAQASQSAKNEDVGTKTSPPLPFFQALKMATEIRVYKTSPTFPEFITPEYVKPKPLVVLSETSHPRMFHLLKHTRPRRASENFGRNLTNSRVSLLANGKLIEDVGYFPTSGGIIGLWGDGGIAPDEFVEWPRNLEDRLGGMGRRASKYLTRKSPEYIEVPMAAPVQLPDALRAATEIRFYRPGTRENLLLTPYAVLSEHSQPQFFQEIKATVCHRQSGGTQFTDQIAIVFAEGKPIARVGYDPAEGRLIEPYAQSGQVPEELRQWLSRSAALPESMGHG